MTTMAEKKQDASNAAMPKLQKFLSGYSNANSRSGYKNAIDSFLRCIYGLKKEDIKAGKLPVPDYNSLFRTVLTLQAG
jgi:hypothetical protein